MIGCRAHTIRNGAGKLSLAGCGGQRCHYEKTKEQRLHGVPSRDLSDIETNWDAGAA